MFRSLHAIRGVRSCAAVPIVNSRPVHLLFCGFMLIRIGSRLFSRAKPHRCLIRHCSICTFAPCLSWWPRDRAAGGAVGNHAGPGCASAAGAGAVKPHRAGGRGQTGRRRVTVGEQGGRGAVDAPPRSAAGVATGPGGDLPGAGRGRSCPAFSGRLELVLARRVCDWRSSSSVI